MSKILIIEDELLVRENIAELLEASGHQTRQAFNGKQALKIIEEFLPDLVISDITMPEMDGFETLELFQSSDITAAIPFIFLTARTGIEFIRAGMNKGADDYLVKPFNSEDLLKAVETRLNKKHKQDRSKEELIKNITNCIPHELRTPMSAISGYSQLLLDDYTSLSNEEKLNFIQKIKAGNLQLNSIVEKFIILSDLFCLLKNPVMKFELLKAKTISAHAIIEYYAIAKAKMFSRNKYMHISLEECSLGIDENYLTILISELVENAFKFSKASDQVIIFGRKKGNNYVLRILDNGIGMTKEQLNCLDAFNQFNREQCQHSGNGLGITIARKIIELFNGKFEITSEQGIYTEVIITLKLISES